MEGEMGSQESRASGQLLSPWALRSWRTEVTAASRARSFSAPQLPSGHWNGGTSSWEGRWRSTEEVGASLALPNQQQDHGRLLHPSSLAYTAGADRGRHLT